MANTRQYTKEEKYEAAMHYMVTGNQTKTARELGIPQKTIQQWISRDDKDFVEAYIRASDTNLKKYDAKVSSLIDKALRVLEKKLEHPEDISAKDAALVHNMLFDKRQIARARPTQIKQTDTSQLSQLAQAFAQIAQSNTPKSAELEVITHEEIVEEREK